MNKEWKRKLFRLASLVGTDAKNPKEKLLAYVNSQVDKIRGETIKECDDKVMTIESKILTDGYVAGVKRTLEVAEKLYKDKQSELHGGYDDSEYLEAYGMALFDLKEKLKGDILK